MRALACALTLALTATAVGAQEPIDTEAAERRIIEYIKTNAKSGERLVLSKLYSEVFTAPDERAALDKLTGSFFRIPLYVVEFEEGEGRMPTLEEISGQFAFYGPEEASVVLSVMELDPRVPKFITRDPKTGEITDIDVDMVREDRNFGKAIERHALRVGRQALSFRIRHELRGRGDERRSVRRDSGARLRVVHQLPAVRQDRARAHRNAEQVSGEGFYRLGIERGPDSEAQV